MNERISIADKKPERKSQNSVSQIRRKSDYSQSMNSPVDRIHFLQRIIGNQTVARLIESGALHAKLMIGQPGDIYEQEADRVADQVMRMPEPCTGLSAHIQRKCPKCEEEMQPLKTLQARGDHGADNKVTPEIEFDINFLIGSGEPLAESTRTFFEPRFGYDLSQVRVHTDANAAESARAMNARAFTTGRDVVFGAGQYSPGTQEGQKLLAHELTHVVQQKVSHTIYQDTWLRRVHIENGRKVFDCQAYAGDSKLEACLNNESRLRPFDTGDSVIRVQTGLQADGEYKGVISGIYDANTGQAVMAFKRNHHLGFEQYPDVGPGTMKKLDELCAGPIVPPQVNPPTPFPNLPPPVPPGKIPGPEKPPDTPANFCVPYSNVSDAMSNWAWVYLAMMEFTSRFGSDVQDLWRTYLTNPKSGTKGTLPPRRLFGNQTSRIVEEFRQDYETVKQKNRVMKLIAERVRSNPVLMPQPGYSTPLMNFQDVLDVSEVQDLPMTFTNGDTRIPGNIAGGYGKNASDAGDDVRSVDGKFIATNLGDSTLWINASFVFDVLDCVDFCPGAPGDWRAQLITIPMSRLEATPDFSTYDVPFEVIYGLHDDQYF